MKICGLNRNLTTIKQSLNLLSVFKIRGSGDYAPCKENQTGDSQKNPSENGLKNTDIFHFTPPNFSFLYINIRYVFDKIKKILQRGKK